MVCSQAWCNLSRGGTAANGEGRRSLEAWAPYYAVRCQDICGRPAGDFCHTPFSCPSMASALPLIWPSLGSCRPCCSSSSPCTITCHIVGSNLSQALNAHALQHRQKLGWLMAGDMSFKKPSESAAKALIGHLHLALGGSGPDGLLRP